jgi:hypothetical protein
VAPRTGRSYDAIVVGWSAYALIAGRARRVAFLSDLRSQAEPGAPLLLSYFVRAADDPLDYEVVRRVGGLLRRARADDPLELGDTLEANFVHTFTKEEVAEELIAAGWTPRWWSADGTAHTVATAL